MFRFIESICVLNHFPHLISLHQQRVNRTFRDILGGKPPKLEELAPPKGKFIKWRILYDKNGIVSTDYHNYQTPKIHSLSLVNSPGIDYNYKYEDRQELNRLYTSRGNADDILICKNGFITDSFYANVAFKKNGHWFTPSKYLLNGVRRQHLLHKGLLVEKESTAQDVHEYESVCLINAMIDLGEVTVPTHVIGSI